MPSLRYGRDITDDAAFLVGELDRAMERAKTIRLSVQERRDMADRAKLIEERIKQTYGRVSSARALAEEAGEFTDSYTSEGRAAAGLQNTVQTRPPLSKRANAIVNRLMKRGKIQAPTVYDENDSGSPVQIRPPRVGSNPASPALRAAREAQARQIVPKANSKRPGRPNKAVERAFEAPKKASPAKKAAQPRRPRGGGRA